MRVFGWCSRAAPPARMVGYEILEAATNISTRPLASAELIWLPKFVETESMDTPCRMDSFRCSSEVVWLLVSLEPRLPLPRKV